MTRSWSGFQPRNVIQTSIDNSTTRTKDKGRLLPYQCSGSLFVSRVISAVMCLSCRRLRGRHFAFTRFSSTTNTTNSVGLNGFVERLVCMQESSCHPHQKAIILSPLGSGALLFCCHFVLRRRSLRKWEATSWQESTSCR